MLWEPLRSTCGFANTSWGSRCARWEGGCAGERVQYVCIRRSITASPTPHHPPHDAPASCYREPREAPCGRIRDRSVTCLSGATRLRLGVCARRMMAGRGTGCSCVRMFRYVVRTCVLMSLRLGGRWRTMRLVEFDLGACTSRPGTRSFPSDMLRFQA